MTKPFLLKLIVTSTLLMSLPLAGQTTQGNVPKKPEFMKIDDEEPTSKKPTFIKIDEDEDSEGHASEEEAPKEPTWDELGGESFTGIPRLIRQNTMTEVFFKDLKNSYVIHFNSNHNAYFKVFLDSSRTSTPVTFRADPVSRRIFVVDGVNGMKAPPKAPANSPTKTSPTSTTSGKTGSQ